MGADRCQMLDSSQCTSWEGVITVNVKHDPRLVRPVLYP